MLAVNFLDHFFEIHVVIVVGLVLPVHQDFIVIMFQQVFPCCHQKAGGTTGRVADGIRGLGFQQFHHHVDSMIDSILKFIEDNVDAEIIEVQREIR